MVYARIIFVQGDAESDWGGYDGDVEVWKEKARAYFATTRALLDDVSVWVEEARRMRRIV